MQVLLGREDLAATLQQALSQLQADQQASLGKRSLLLHALSWLDLM